MNRRRILLAAGVIAGVLAAILYQSSAQRTDVVVAARELGALHPLRADDLTTRALPADSIPAGAHQSAASLVGRYLSAPLAQGQLVLAASVADDAAQFSSGLRPPAGTRAIAVPVTAAHALGGAIVPGGRVDLIAVPIAGRAPDDRTVELLAESALVLDVRTDTGHALAREAGRQTGMLERIGSVVLAVPAGYEMLVADRIASSTFVLAVSPR